MARKTVIKESESAPFTAGKALFFLGGAAMLGVGGYWLIGKANAQNMSDALMSDPNKQLALRVKNSLKKGFFAKTDVGKLYEIAPLLNNWQAVSAAYAQAGYGVLSNDLQAELTADELNRFMNLVNNSKRESTLKAQGRIPTPLGFFANLNSLSRGGVTYTPGMQIQAKGIATTAYEISIPDRYPSGWSMLNFKATGAWTIVKMLAYYDQSDSTKNTYLIQVKQGNKTVWQSWFAFNF